MPEEFRALEGKLRESIEKRVSRGKLDINLRYRGTPTPGRLTLDSALLTQLRQLEHEVAVALPNALPASRLRSPVVSRGWWWNRIFDQAGLFDGALALPRDRAR